MNRAPALALAAALAAAGCDSKPKPLPVRPGAGSVARAEKATDAARPAPPEWTYTSVGKRDPFRSFLGTTEGGAASLSSRCPTPLGRFELDQVKLVAVVVGLEDPVAMVEAPNGIGYSLRRGACLGKNGGVVAAVRTGEVVVSEWAVRADGTRDRTQTVLRLPREASLNLEE